MTTKHITTKRARLIRKGEIKRIITLLMLEVRGEKTLFLWLDKGIFICFWTGNVNIKRVVWGSNASHTCYVNQSCLRWKIEPIKSTAYITRRFWANILEGIKIWVEIIFVQMIILSYCSHWITSFSNDHYRYYSF